MKASLRFRDEQKPLVRAKVPISVLGLPFLSGFAAGDAREFRLDLATAFESGPSLRLSYRPNDPWSPFTLAVKTGIGPLGSPAAAPLTMCAEFNLVGRGAPGFSIQLKPWFGDFCLRKATSSAPGSSPPFLLGGAGAVSDHDTDGESSADGGETPSHGNGTLFGDKKPNEISTGVRSAAAAGGIRGLVSGAELSARSVLPLRKGTAVKFRWGLKIPSELRSGFGEDIGSKDPISRIARKLPLLVMNKISIEHVAAAAKPQEKAAAAAPVGDVAEVCFSLQRQLAALQAENGTLRKAVEELRADLGARGPEPGALTARSTPPEVRERKPPEGNRKGARAVEPARNGGDSGKKGGAKAAEAGGKGAREDVNEELRKALLGATGGGA